MFNMFYRTRANLMKVKNGLKIAKLGISHGISEVYPLSPLPPLSPLSLSPFSPSLSSPLFSPLQL
jgi:hypothetical protein